jgi:ammonium transporter, Amt family
MHFIPGLRIRVDDDAEIIGIDDAEMGEYAYDYVGLESEIRPNHNIALAGVGAKDLNHEHISGVEQVEKAGSATS